MIHVITTVQLNPGSLGEYIPILQKFVSRSRSENGCLSYNATVDVDADIAIQEMVPDTVMLIEIWESIDCLKAHFASDSSEEYRESVKDLVSMVTMRVMNPLA
jgi:quinol monooxygenase YgiN